MEVLTKQIRDKIYPEYDRAREKHSFWLDQCHKWEQILALLDLIDKEAKQMRTDK